MHPPFFHVDHKIGPDIHHDGDSKPVTRRNQAERLHLRACVAGWPPVPLFSGGFGDNGALLLPSGATLPPPLALRIVPPPQHTLRDFVGRMLIRAGQRMIMENRARGN